MHPALGITELSRAGQELRRNHRSVICMELFIVPLHKSDFFKKGNSVSATDLGEHAVKHGAVYSTTTTCTQVWEDVTAESQAFQPERKELLL